MNSGDFTQLGQFQAYAQKRFDLSLLAGCFADTRPRPDIPSRAVGLSLVLGEVVHIPSFLQLQAETKVPQWQAWVGYRADAPGFAVAAQATAADLQRAQAFLQAFLERAADGHGFADAFHLRGERGVGLRKFLEGEARNLGDDVIIARLEIRRCKIVNIKIKKIVDT